MPYGRYYRRRYPYRARYRRSTLRRRLPIRRRLPLRPRRRWGGRRPLRYGRSVTRIPRAPLPNVLYLKFHYAEQTTGTVNQTAPVFIVPFYANNPYDPVVGVSTVGCSGFSAVMSIYAWCMCFGCKATVKFAIAQANVIEVYSFIMFESHDAPRSINATNLITLDYLRENPIHVKSRLMYDMTTANTKPTWMSMYRRIKSLENNGKLDVYQYRCSRTSGPTLNTRCTIGFRTSDTQSTQAIPVRMHWKLTYYCRVWERINLDG